MPLIFTNLTRANEIGANCYDLQLDGRRIVLDAGMHPRAEETSWALPQFSLVPDGSVDAIVLSHAHQDHVGALPVLMRRHPKAPVFMSGPTWQLSEVMLHNSVNVMTRRREEGIGGEVFFTHREVDQATRRWRAVPLHTRFDLTGERIAPSQAADEVTLQFYDAGHILGSTGTMIRSGEHSIFYTGDVNFDDQTVMRAAHFPEEPVETLIVETTRGDHQTLPGFSRQGEEERFAEAIHETLGRGGCVFIPVFALGKTQEVLTMLLSFIDRRLIPEVPIYIGGLSTKLTEITDRLTQGERSLLQRKGIFTLSGPDAFATKLRPGRIYALSSGMMTEQTPSNRLARQILSDPKHALFFVGYADPDSPAGRLLETPPDELVQLSPDAERQALRCRMEQFSFSGHSTREGILAYINRVRPKNVFLVHGDAPALAWFREAVQRDLPGTRVIVPEPGVPIEVP